MSSPANGSGPLAPFLSASAQAETARLAALERDARLRALTAAQLARRPGFVTARRAIGGPAETAVRPGPGGSLNFDRDPGGALGPVFALKYDADLSEFEPAIRVALLRLAAEVRGYDGDPAVLAAGFYTGKLPRLAERLRRIDLPLVAARFPDRHPARGAVKLLLTAVDSPDLMLDAVSGILADPWARAALGWLPLLAALIDPGEHHPEPAGVFVPENKAGVFVPGDKAGDRVWRRAFNAADRPDLQPLLAHAWYADRFRLALLCRGGDAAAQFPGLESADSPVPTGTPDPALIDTSPSTADAVASLVPPAAAEVEPATACDNPSAIDRQTLALAMLAEAKAEGRRLDLTAVAARVGVPRQRLYDSPEFRVFKRAAQRMGFTKAGSGRSGPRGHRTADGNVEAYAEADD